MVHWPEARPIPATVVLQWNPSSNNNHPRRWQDRQSILRWDQRHGRGRIRTGSDESQRRGRGGPEGRRGRAAWALRGRCCFLSMMENSLCWFDDCISSNSRGTAKCTAKTKTCTAFARLCWLRRPHRTQRRESYVPTYMYLASTSSSLTRLPNGYASSISITWFQYLVL